LSEGELISEFVLTRVYFCWDDEATIGGFLILFFSWYIFKCNNY